MRFEPHVRLPWACALLALCAHAQSPTSMPTPPVTLVSDTRSASLVVTMATQASVNGTRFLQSVWSGTLVDDVVSAVQTALYEVDVHLTDVSSGVYVVNVAFPSVSLETTSATLAADAARMSFLFRLTLANSYAVDASLGSTPSVAQFDDEVEEFFDDVESANVQSRLNLMVMTEAALTGLVFEDVEYSTDASGVETVIVDESVQFVISLAEEWNGTQVSVGDVDAGENGGYADEFGAWFLLTLAILALVIICVLLGSLLFWYLTQDKMSNTVEDEEVEPSVDYDKVQQERPIRDESEEDEEKDSMLATGDKYKGRTEAGYDRDDDDYDRRRDRGYEEEEEEPSYDRDGDRDRHRDRDRDRVGRHPMKERGTTHYYKRASYFADEEAARELREHPVIIHANEMARRERRAMDDYDDDRREQRRAIRDRLLKLERDQQSLEDDMADRKATFLAHKARSDDDDVASIPPPRRRKPKRASRRRYSDEDDDDDDRRRYSDEE